MLARRALVVALLVAAASPAASQDVALPPLERGVAFTGRALNTTAGARGDFRLEINGFDPATRSLRAYLTASNGLMGEGPLDGTLAADGALTLAGTIVGYPIRVVGRVQGETVHLAYELATTPVQRGTASLTRVGAGVAAAPTAPTPSAPPAPAAPVAAPPAPGARFKVGDQITAGCWGSTETATVLAVEPGRYRVKFESASCGEHRNWDEVKPAAAPAAPSADRPGPARITAGRYACSENVSRYAGSVSVNGRSVPQYSFHVETRGTVTLGADGTYRAGGGPAARFAYDQPTGRIRWLGGVFAGEEFAGGRYETDPKTRTGRLVVLVRGATRPAEWVCSGSSGS